MKQTIAAILFALTIGNCYGQRGCILAENMPEKPKRGDVKVSIIDSVSIVNAYAIISTDKLKVFVLDTGDLSICCFDDKGKRIWKTNPQRCAEMKHHGYVPCVSSFWLEKYYSNKIRKNAGELKEALWICYSDQEFGFLNQETGAFTYCGNLN